MNDDRGYIFEAEMIPVLKENFLSTLLTTFEGRNMLIDEEVRSTYGIPDLVFYDFNETALGERIFNKVDPILSKDILKALLLIQGKTNISLSFLEEALPYKKEVIKNKIIKFLIKNNYLSKSVKTDHFWIENEYKTVLNTLYSIEAKIADWKRGFYQAYRYKWFSNCSFLAIETNHINAPLKNIELFKEHNIGLIEVAADDKKMKIHYECVFEKPKSKEHTALTFERLFSIYLGKKASSHSK